MVEKKIKHILDKKGISIYKLSKDCGIKYELLRRVFVGERKLTADEMILIMNCANIKFDELKEQSDILLCSVG